MTDQPKGNGFRKIAFLASPIEEAERARDALQARYGGVCPDKADVIVALGGDGLMLQVLHRFMNSGKPIYGMNRGSVGFLMNEYSEDDLIRRLDEAERAVIRPLSMRPSTLTGANIPRSRSTRSRCCARPFRPPSCVSLSTARCGCPN
jgi:NAD+ kinase